MLTCLTQILPSFTDIAHDEDEMAAVLAEQGPISIAVDASQTWHKYQQGILTNCTLGKKPRLDHGVLLVGLGSEDGQRYWTVKKLAPKSPLCIKPMLA